MQIKNITLKKIQKGNLKAVGSINFEDIFVVHGIRLIEGQDGLFLSFPARIKKDGNFLDIAHPINSDFRTMLTDEVIKKYKELEI